MKSIKQMLMGISILLLSMFLYYILAGLVIAIVPTMLAMYFIINGYLDNEDK